MPRHIPYFIIIDFGEEICAFAANNKDYIHETHRLVFGDRMRMRMPPCYSDAEQKALIEFH